jgi:hypothetical protein
MIIYSPRAVTSTHSIPNHTHTIHVVLLFLLISMGLKSVSRRKFDVHKVSTIFSVSRYNNALVVTPFSDVGRL